MVCEGQFPSARPGRSTLTPEDGRKRHDDEGRAGCALAYAPGTGVVRLAVEPRWREAGYWSCFRTAFMA